MKRLLLLPLIALFALSFVHISNADVFVEDANVNIDSDIGGLTSGTIDSGSGNIGDYELVVCGIDTNGIPNPFNLPSPGSWNEIHNGTCFGPECQFGIWGRFTNSESSEEITCSWGDDSLGFTAGSIRYSNVDQDNPIIDVACSEFDGQDLVIPALASEPGAQLVFLQLFHDDEPGEDFEDVSFDEFAVLFLAAVDLQNENLLFFLGESDIDEFGEGFPEIVIPGSVILDIDIDICVLSIRMQPKVIPTMSEWGMIGFAAFAGLAGLFFLRRRQLAV